MAKVTYGSTSGRIRQSKPALDPAARRTPEDVVRDLKKAGEKPGGADYRERSLAISGLICARCGREFEPSNRRLLTVHHIDGNHDNNPRDGSNWVNLCVYCHEDIHSRGLLGDYFAGLAGRKDADVVYGDKDGAGMGSLAEKLAEAMRAKEKKKK